MLGTTVVVWSGHRGVFEAAGYDYRRFKGETLAEFTEFDTLRSSLVKRGAVQQKPLAEILKRAEPRS